MTTIVLPSILHAVMCQGFASDIFTCGLILYELLAGRHPYWSEDQGEYAKLVHAHAAKPPALAGLMPPPASNAEVSSALHRCLSHPIPAARPSAAELRTILSGRAAAVASRRAAWQIATRASVVPAVRGPASASAGQPIVANALELQEASGRSLNIRVRTELTKSLMQQLGSDAEFWDARQCVVERNAGQPMGAVASR